jgi:hypothetical protein
MKDTETLALVLLGVGVISVLAILLLKPGQSAPMMQGLTGYTNDETWEINRDGTGRINSVTIHRKAVTS